MSRVIAAESIGYGKWAARLDCGHICTLDTGVDSPRNEHITCLQCLSTEDIDEDINQT